MAEETTATEPSSNRHLHNVLNYLLNGGSEEDHRAAVAGVAHVDELAKQDEPEPEEDA